jgi:hypothetical protein
MAKITFLRANEDGFVLSLDTLFCGLGATVWFFAKSRIVMRTAWHFLNCGGDSNAILPKYKVCLSVFAHLSKG